MDRNVSPCGVVCPECKFYPGDCAGCAAIEGKVFWLQYMGGDVCDIYQCCIHDKGLAHCGLCAELPCNRYDQKDPTMSDEENEAGFQKQMATLRALAAEQ